MTAIPIDEIEALRAFVAELPSRLVVGRRAEAEAIAAVLNAAPRLLDTIEEQRREIDQLRKALDVSRIVGKAALMAITETPDEKDRHIARLQREKEELGLP